ncbi:arsenate reductase (glutaredoxin) [Marixanthomonas spongiae]|uniref:Arsenate reductase (Glutaredoxin) n=1 Tax=Marixanthomonas spongiae TaxID=2174845 RepID=A0A2U0HYG4_9FLAO|nr:arsenate reductase (glutaredoxin) [Marixanthomonas spongiae]PVW13878.1 arsenate reductase (glutaredoxin) [Marixanthomonas spongiae]
MTTIYHNPRCSKSRQTLQLLEEENEEINIVKYLETPPNKAELKNIIDLLGVKPSALVRKNEKIWKENFKGKELSQEEIIDAMIAHPKLIERPIVIKDNKATIGRPPENILSIL